MEESRSGFVALVGAPNAGKSTLMNRILGEKVSITAPKPQTTRNRILGIYTESDCQAVFVDTPGIHRTRDQFNQILVETALSALKDVDVICFLVEAPEADKEVNAFILEILEGVSTPIILVINKIDLVAKHRLLPVMESYSKKRNFEAIVPVSALLNDGLKELMDEILHLLPEGPPYYPPEYLTDQPERFLVAELVREKVFHLVHQEVPYAVAVTVDSFVEEPERRRIRIEATIHVERSSQKGILIGKQGQMLKEVGKRAREDMESLLGCPVFLGLHVRVQKKWRKDLKALADMGYRKPR